MQSLTEPFTPRTNELQAFNLEIRQKLLSMPSCTRREIESLEAWLEEAQAVGRHLENISLIIYHHLELFRIKLEQQQK